MTGQSNLIEDYLAFVGVSEAQMHVHRWAIMAGIAALLGTRVEFPFGDNFIRPNLYVMIVGNPGSRKSVAIKKVARLVAATEGVNMSLDNTSLQQLRVDLSEISYPSEGNEDSPDDILGCFEESSGRPATLFAPVDEFNDWAGNDIIAFVKWLGTVWDARGLYETKTRNHGTFRIKDPCLTILGGNTRETLAETFPPGLIGQGFFSRVLFISADRSEHRLTIPPKPDAALKESIIERLREVATLSGPMSHTPEAFTLLDTIYHKWKPTLDPRFASYYNRRLDQLIKLAMIHAAAEMRMEVDAGDILYANTVLAFAEHLMPKVLSRFGTSRNAEALFKILSILSESPRPLSTNEIWAMTVADFTKVEDMIACLTGLTKAGKIMQVKGKHTVVRAKLQEQLSGLVDPSILTVEEQGIFSVGANV